MLYSIMVKIAKIRHQMETAPTNVSFTDLSAICEHYFGEPRQSASHQIYKTPWPGDPRVNIQRGKGGKAKPYQVRQILAAIEKLDAETMTKTAKGETHDKS
jgi:hypothetical protein